MALQQIIARNVRRYREDREFSMGELARRSGLSKQTIASLEAGRGNPTVQTLDDLAAALATSVRALTTEMGNDVLASHGTDARWHEQGAMKVRALDQAYGSGNVVNSLLRLETNRGIAHQRPASRATLRHCYVVEGRVRLGPESAPVVVQATDFVRFPGDVPHIFEALTPMALVLVCTTSPQLSMTESGRYF